MKLRTAALSGAAILMATVFAAPSYALIIAEDPGTPNSLWGTDVGDPDTILGQTSDYTEGGTICTAFAGITLEDCWAESVAGTTLDFADATKTGNVQAYATNDPDVIAFEFVFGSGYYLIKNSTWSAVLFNVADFDWGVIDTSLLNAGFNLTGSNTTISHLTESPTTTVPEPGILTLLGSGLLAAGLIRRRRKIA